VLESEELDMKNRGSQSVLKDKSFRSAGQIGWYNHPQQKNHFNLDLSRQLLRSGSSIRATVEEALRGQCSKDFISKLAIAAKEAREAGYWLRLIRDTYPHNHPELADLLAKCDELAIMLNGIILTTRRKLAAADARLQLRTHNSELGEAVDSEPRTQHSEFLDA
jgi:four helix bundle protein